MQKTGFDTEGWSSSYPAKPRTFSQCGLNSNHLIKQDVLKEYKDVCTGLGKLKEKLNQMECDRIIAIVDKPTNWVNSLVIVEKKDGSLRLCLDLDPKD